MYICMHLYPREFAFVYMHKRKLSFLRAFACVRLRACLRAELIKTQNAFARKIFQHANALCVQKLSGCTIGVVFSAWTLFMRIMRGRGSSHAP